MWVHFPSPVFTPVLFLPCAGRCIFHWQMDVVKTSESEASHLHQETLGYVITGLFRIVESENPLSWEGPSQ